MQALTLLMLVAVTTFEYFGTGGPKKTLAVLPNGSEYLAELTGLAAAIVVVIAGTRNHYKYVQAQYWIVFGILAATIACGAWINDVGAGPVFAGARTYLRAIPWFFVGAVFAFPDSQLKTQLKALLAIALLQLPLALDQRLVSSGMGVRSGDFTFGTMMNSSIMSIFLIGAICIAAAMFIRGRLKLGQFIVLFLLLLIPTAINETKATVILLPLSLFVAFYSASRPGHRLKVVLTALIAVSVAGAIFVPIYEHYNVQREYSEPLAEKLSSAEYMGNYLQKTDDIGAARMPGRIDSILVPFKRMKHDPPQLAFGFGIGNVSDSAVGKQFVGAQFGRFGPYLKTTIARLMLELGLFGVALVLVLMWFVFRDARTVSRWHDGLTSTLAAGWVGVTALVAVSMLYTDLIISAPISYVFWYFSGLIAAARMRGMAAITNTDQKAEVHGLPRQHQSR